MRFIRNFLLTIICIAAIGAGVLFGYYRFRGSRETELLSNGLSLMEQGNYRLARDKFAEAQQYEDKITRYLSDDSLEEDLYRYTAICDFRLGEIEAAASLYDKLLMIHPRDPSLIESRAAVYAAQGDMEQAVELFDTAIAMDRWFNHIKSFNGCSGYRYLTHGEEISPISKRYRCKASCHGGNGLKPALESLDLSRRELKGRAATDIPYSAVETGITFAESPA